MSAQEVLSHIHQVDGTDLPVMTSRPMPVTLPSSLTAKLSSGSDAPVSVGVTWREKA
jgi:hypothetical protein